MVDALMESVPRSERRVWGPAAGRPSAAGDPVRPRVRRAQRTAGVDDDRGGAGYVAAMAGYGVMAARYFRIQIPLLLLAAGVTAAACWWLVPRAGLTGAVLALCLMGATQLVSRVLIIAHAIRVPAGTSPAAKVVQS